MKTAEQIARKLRIYLAVSLKNQQSDEFLAIITSALHEYGAAVRQRASGVCLANKENQQVGDSGIAHEDACDQCAAAIERMDLP